jgi:phosphoadenosine phosphosulfate reductase
VTLALTNKIKVTTDLLRVDISSNKTSVWLSSSFQTQSVPLLHLVGQLDIPIKVVFIDTGFLFPETYAFKRQLEDLFNLDVLTVKSAISYYEQRLDDGLFLYSNDVDRCCHINKVKPLEGVINPGDVWVSGVRRDQTALRKEMKTREVDKRGVMRLHPMLDWNARDIYQYIKEHKLPKHPLEEKGYISIGCVPCTHKYDQQGARGGRWVGSKKTECGLHIENRN